MEQTVSELLKGTVVFFSSDKGYGFIRHKDKQYFVHFSDIAGEGYRNLEKGQLVEFQATDQGKGDKALNVRPL